MKKLFLAFLLFLPSLSLANTPPFKVGEKLVYNVSWFIFPAGEAGLDVRRLEVVNGAPCYHFVAWAKSTIAFFFEVNDRIESYATTETLTSAQFEKHLREGSYKKDQVIPFDLNSSTAKYQDENLPVGPGCRDALAAFYHFRMMPLPEPGSTVTICSHADKKNYPLLIKVLKREEVEVEAGKFKTILIKVLPQPGFEGLFRNKGDLWIWLTDDEKRIPVQIKAEVAILGSVKIKLKKLEIGQ